MVYLPHRADVGLSHPHVARGTGGIAATPICGEDATGDAAFSAGVTGDERGGGKTAAGQGSGVAGR